MPSKKAVDQRTHTSTFLGESQKGPTPQGPFPTHQVSPRFLNNVAHTCHHQQNNSPWGIILGYRIGEAASNRPIDIISLDETPNGICFQTEKLPINQNSEYFQTPPIFIMAWLAFRRRTHSIPHTGDPFFTINYLQSFSHRFFQTTSARHCSFYSVRRSTAKYMSIFC